MYATAYVPVERAANHWVGRRGLEREGGNREETAAHCGEQPICQLVFSVVLRYWEAAAVIMTDYNGEKWKDHGLRLPSTWTEIWTGRKNATAF